MRSLFFRLTIYLFLFTFTVGECAFAQSEQEHGADRKTKTEFNKAFGALNFIENKGQWEPEVLYLATMNEQRMWFTKHGLRLDLFEMEVLESNDSNHMAASIDQQIPAEMKVKGHVFDMELLNASTNYEVMEANCNPGYYNYFLGNDPEKWVRRAASYTELWRRDAYPGIDVHYYPSTKGLMEYDFIVAPHTDPSQIVMRYSGLDQYSLDEEGNLLLITALGDVPISRPYSYQIIDGQTQTIASNYILDADGTISFEFPDGYDVNRPLVIDPMILEWSTFVHGSGSDDYVRSMSLTAGSLEPVITGFTISGTFPNTTGAYQNSYSGGQNDIFVTKLTTDGTALIYSTFIGGDGTDDVFSIDCDASGGAVITGATFSSDYPLSNPYNSSLNGSWDIFLTKLNATGDALVFSTYFGSPNYDRALCVRHDSANNPIITGSTLSSSFPTTTGAYSNTSYGNYEVFVTKFNATGSALLFSTYLGGTGGDYGHSLTLNGSDEIFITGKTGSADFPVTVGSFDPSYNGTVDHDVFISKLNSTGALLEFSTYIGGDNVDIPLAITLDSYEDILVVGYTQSTNFPSSPSAYDPTFNGPQDGFLLKLSSDGSSLIFSTFVGGDDIEHCSAVCTDSENAIYTLSGTRSLDAPTSPDALFTANQGFYDIYLSKFSSSGDALLYATYFGSPSDEYPKDFSSLFSVDHCVIGISTIHGSNFPITPFAFQQQKLNGISDTPAVFKLCELIPTCPIYSLVLPESTCDEESIVFEAINTACAGTTHFRIVGDYGATNADEITWELRSDLTTNLLASGGPGIDDEAILLFVNVDVTTEGNEFTLTLFDSSGDGLSNGGSFHIEVDETPITVPITGNFGTSTCESFQTSTFSATSTMSIQTPSGMLVDSNDICEDHLIDFNLANNDFCNPLSVEIPYEIICNETSDTLYSDIHTLIIHPRPPASAEDLINIRWDSTTCEWLIHPQNDCDLLDIGTVFNISPDPTSWVNNTVEGGSEIFTVDYLGTENALQCAPLGLSWSLYREYTYCHNSYFYIPNTFTPDGNEFNHFFEVVFSPESEIEEFNLSVWNRWGELIRESHDTTFGWDGTYNGKEAPVDTYIWRLNFREADQVSSEFFTGHITLLR